MSPRYITKSRFKLALQCPTKIYYDGKPEYANQKLEDTFLLALADGGFQVGELAKCYFPGGHVLSIFVLRPIILRDYYGKTYIGSIMGLCFGLGAIGSVCGPPLAGWIFDTTGSYDLAWIISSVLLLIGIPLVLLTKSPSPE